MVKNIRALLIGDEKVGKTTLVKTLISDKYPTSVPLVVPPAVIPAEINNNVELTIVDSYYRRDSENDRELINELVKWDTVLIVFDASRTDSTERLRNFWLPFVQSFSQLPIILVGNKVDIKITDNLQY